MVFTWTHGIDNTHGIDSDSWYSIVTPESHTNESVECCLYAVFFKELFPLQGNFTKKFFKNHKDESQKCHLWAWSFSFEPLTWNWPSSVVYCNMQWCTILRCTIPWLCTSIKGPVQGKGNKRYGINMTSWPGTRCPRLIHSSGFWPKGNCQKVSP